MSLVRRQLGLLLAVALCCFGHRLLALELDYDYDGAEVVFHLIGTKPESRYNLRIIDLVTDQQIAEITEFEAGSVSGVRNSKWNPDIDEGIFRLVLEVNGEKFHLDDDELDFRTVQTEFIPVKINRRLGKLHWSLPVAALTRVIAYTDTGLKVASIRPWTFLPPGNYTESWSFKDADGVKDYRDDPQLNLYAQAYPLPSNILIIGEPLLDGFQAIDDFKNLELTNERYEFDVTLLSQGEGSQSSIQEMQGLPVLRPGDAVRVSLKESTKHAMGSKRFEVLFYWDDQFLHEETDSLNPCTFIFPNVPDFSGKQYLTVNVKDLVGGWGVKTIPVYYLPSKTLQ
ncbi:hypothetical protein [Rubellicoccus peritrichatus]|uniref:Uncharacterized protein n=1 Tax=Rubellicoccus peritrichatus TaxID=3080537 RepID=A0AAQ3LFU9_9BACT|nr:hypothetical protein [Puniceicoccus sp. CR14]WOO43033.1 hypothetical protein RZN69_08000 [Puniceicoccus sp. CR14]